MKVDIKLVKPEEISLDTLVDIQEKSFPKTYPEDCRISLKDQFYGGSYGIALHKNKVVAYYKYLTIDDKYFNEYAGTVKYFLMWRAYVLSGNSDLTKLIEQCGESSGLNVNEYNHDIKAFPGEVTFDEKKDAISVELAVLPEYRKKGVATKLIREVRKKLKSENFEKIFFTNRKDSVMYKLNLRRGDSKILFQVGPAFKDGGSLVLWSAEL